MKKKLFIGILVIIVAYFSYRMFFAATVGNTYPFAKADKVELVFYKEVQEGGGNLKKFSKIPFKRKVELNEKEKENIFEILYKENCFVQSMAACYDPRHALLFMKQKDTIGIIEICLECSQFKVTDGIEKPKMCDEMAEKLETFFKSKQ